MRRRRRSADEIEGLCAQFRESNLTQRQFAAEVGVSVGAVQHWLRRDGRGGLARVSRFVEALPVRHAPEAGECRIELPAGIAVTCRTLPPPEYLGALVRSLRTP